MVMFHHEIPYRTALERGAVQAEMLAELTQGAVSTLAEVDFERAEREIHSRLVPLLVGPRHSTLDGSAPQLIRRGLVRSSVMKL